MRDQQWKSRGAAHRLRFLLPSRPAGTRRVWTTSTAERASRPLQHAYQDAPDHLGDTSSAVSLDEWLSYQLHTAALCSGRADVFVWMSGPQRQPGESPCRFSCHRKKAMHLVVFVLPAAWRLITLTGSATRLCGRSTPTPDLLEWSEFILRHGSCRPAHSSWLPSYPYALPSGGRWGPGASASCWRAGDRGCRVRVLLADATHRRPALEPLWLWEPVLGSSSLTTFLDGLVLPNLCCSSQRVCCCGSWFERLVAGGTGSLRGLWSPGGLLAQGRATDAGALGGFPPRPGPRAQPRHTLVAVALALGTFAPAVCLGAGQLRRFREFIRSRTIWGSSVRREQSGGGWRLRWTSLALRAGAAGRNFSHTGGALDVGPFCSRPRAAAEPRPQLGRVAAEGAAFAAPRLSRRCGWPLRSCC